MTSLKDFNYEDIKVVGRGQYGKAHLVRSSENQGFFIAKTIELTCLSSKERETALQEVALLRRLDHANIVRYQDNFFMGDTLVIVMQYCDGGDLASYIKDNLKQKFRIQEKVIMNYFVQILSALHYIHQERILHRDLKTSNLFLMKNQIVVKLGDFGISRVLESTMEAANTVVGTPYYMSPEVCENKPYTFKSDVWALGCVLYELCMLKHAFSADNLLGLVYKIVSDKYDPIPKCYSPELNDLIQKMLEKDAEKRPSVRSLFADPAVTGYMNKYIETGGQCATPSVPVARQGGETAGSRKPRPPPPGQSEKTQRDGPGTEKGSAPQRSRSHPRQSAGAGASGSVKKTIETPKEAAARRKREAADRKAQELKQAAMQSVHNKTVARKMKEAEFQSTRVDKNAMMGTVSSSASPGSRIDAPEGSSSHATRGPDGGGHDDGDVTSASEDAEADIESDSQLEEVDEDFSEDYESDFEEDYVTEDEGVVEEAPPRSQVVPAALDAVHEEQDLTRVMVNYQNELAWVHGGAPSPPRRRPSDDATATGAPAPSAGASDAGGSGARRSGAAPAGMQERANRLREKVAQKMGAEMFEKAFDYLLDARKRELDEKVVKKELEALIGRENYKQYCFDIDQVVFHVTMFS